MLAALRLLGAWALRSRSCVLAASFLVGACATRSQPYRFASPMLGAADVPDTPLPRPSGGRPDLGRPDLGRPDPGRPESGHSAVRDPDVTAAPIRVASAAAADQVVTEPAARAVVWSRLPAPHRVAEAARHARGAPEPVARAPSGVLHVPADLRALVGQRDSRDPLSAVLAWERELGTSIEAATGSALVAWAESAGHASAPTSDIAPGDLLVFDRTEGAPADLVAIAIARDARGVTELVYLAGGVVRRGFVDPRRPATRRDSTGAVVNTFMRTGKLWPPKGTHYLAGELLSRIVRAR